VQLLTGESFTINSGPALTGDLLVPGTPTVTIDGHGPIPNPIKNLTRKLPNKSRAAASQSSLRKRPG
jgi:hypothetical protein